MISCSGHLAIRAWAITFLLFAIGGMFAGIMGMIWLLLATIETVIWVNAVMRLHP